MQQPQLIYLHITQILRLKLYNHFKLQLIALIPLDQFAQSKKDNDILIRVIVKKTAGKFAYQSMRNTRTDFPVIACAVSCVGGEYRVSVGARPSKAVVVRDDKNILRFE